MWFLIAKNNKGNCRYYIVHIGDTREYNGIRDDEHILNLIDLKVLSEGPTFISVLSGKINTVYDLDEYL